MPAAAAQRGRLEQARCRPSIAISGPDVLIVWQDTRRDTGDIYFARAAGAAGP